MKEYIIEYHDYDDKVHHINTTEDSIDFYTERLGNLITSIKEIKTERITEDE